MSIKKSLIISSSDNQILPLTGIRFIAAGCVIWTHYLVWLSPFKGGIPSFLEYDTSKYGMTIFFVLSGFVIHLTYSSLFQSNPPLLAIYRFAVARIARLYPLYLFFLFFCLFRNQSYIYRVFHEVEFRNFFFLHLLGIQSWMPFTLNGAISSNGPFHVSWSISTEFFFYLAYPILFTFLRHINTLQRAWRLMMIYSIVAYFSLLFLMSHLDTIAMLCVTIISSDIGVGSNSPSYWLSYVSPFSRLPEFIVGAIGACIFIELKNKVSGAVNNSIKITLDTGLYRYSIIYLFIFSFCICYLVSKLESFCSVSK